MAKLSTRNPNDVFTIIETIGKGTYGSIYKAQDNETKSLVALKKLQFEDEEQLETILNEIEIMRGCANERIVKYYETFKESDDCILISMELCDGGSLSDHYKATQKPLTEEELSFVLKETILGLMFLQSKKKIHRDIKAANLLLTSSGRLKIADFGVAASLQNTLDRRRTAIGSPYWMAPEVIEQEEYSFSADIWSLGITAIELLKGKPPLSEIHAFRALFQIPIRPAPQLEDDLEAGIVYSPELHDFVRKCLKKNESERATLTDLLEHPFIQRSEGKPDDYLKCLLFKQTSSSSSTSTKSSTAGSTEDSSSSSSSSSSSVSSVSSASPSSDTSSNISSSSSSTPASNQSSAPAPQRRQFKIEQRYVPRTNLTTIKAAEEEAAKEEEAKEQSDEDADEEDDEGYGTLVYKQ
ncbi:putative protein serine [Monocercomonoides exilis]|uniref:putative protein serine n=1 Tax=Monocercomonoides exilis TaxID=2049356 RepID=UPI003559CC51|nr:putative protein serine [Monocercomonoides exilis]|eukprot:MONOS_929.1-p1 / transcript=MONOS_929.1 / gene=MONOS_929 / organism=Monocercomonoides_exilis_PA203 / gene_product=protein serine / transcript_product=protein serine / location=Mono_scaffold00015:163048-164669(-) / protein_length=410 / sequence_SO=supercontig / SO=protein_coding / is_pseudo=false